MKHSQTLTIGSPLSEASAACLRAMRRLGWDVASTGAGSRLMTAHEDPARLCCVQSPVTVNAAFEELDDETTAVSLDLSVAGFGPVAANQLRTRRAALEHELAQSLGDAEHD